MLFRSEESYAESTVEVTRGEDASADMTERVHDLMHLPAETRMNIYSMVIQKAEIEGHYRSVRRILEHQKGGTPHGTAARIPPD
jgi:hypothetical protein